jgi:IMP dehydrogenase
VDPLRGPEDVLAEIAQLAPGTEATVRLQALYDEPVKEELIGRRVEELKAGGLAAGSLTPGKVERYHHAALEAGSTCSWCRAWSVTAQHVTDEDHEPLDLRSFTARYDIPVVVGGVASAKSALHLMRTGAVGVLVGLGASSVSTTEAALGIHVPLATAIAEVAAASSRYLEESGRYVQVIAAGGIRTGGDLAKAIACGADAVMLGRPLAAADEAPGRGAYWGVSAAHHSCRAAATTGSRRSGRCRSSSRGRRTVTTARSTSSGGCGARWACSGTSRSPGSTRPSSSSAPAEVTAPARRR